MWGKYMGGRYMGSQMHGGQCAWKIFMGHCSEDIMSKTLS